MTGRDLIIYILQNHLEDEPVFKDGKFIGFMNCDEAAVKFGVGKATLSALASLGQIPSIETEDTILVPGNATIERS